MNLDKELKSYGIFDIKPLDFKSIEAIAKYASNALSSSFPYSNLDKDILYSKFANIPMYYASMPSETNGAMFFIKNDSMYFNNTMKLKDMKVLSVHEFIHRLQEAKDKNGVIYALGLCDYSRNFYLWYGN